MIWLSTQVKIESNFSIFELPGFRLKDKGDSFSDKQIPQIEWLSLK